MSLVGHWGQLDEDPIQYLFINIYQNVGNCSPFNVVNELSFVCGRSLHASFASNDPLCITMTLSHNSLIVMYFLILFISFYFFVNLKRGNKSLSSSIGKLYTYSMAITISLLSMKKNIIFLFHKLKLPFYFRIWNLSLAIFFIGI